MPNNIVKTDRDEELWQRAKERAAAQGKPEDWAYVNGIYQRMQGAKAASAQVEEKIAGVMRTVIDGLKSVGDYAAFSANIPRHMKHYLQDAPRLNTLKEEAEQIKIRQKRNPAAPAFAQALTDAGISPALAGSLKQDRIRGWMDAFDELDALPEAERAARIEAMLGEVSPTLKVKYPEGFEPADQTAKPVLHDEARKLFNLDQDTRSKLRASFAGPTPESIADAARLAEIDTELADLEPVTKAYGRRAADAYRARSQAARTVGVLGGGAVAANELLGRPLGDPVEIAKNTIMRPVTNAMDDRRRRSETTVENLHRQYNNYLTSGAMDAGLALSGAGTLGTAALSAAMPKHASSKRPRVEVILQRPDGQVFLVATPHGWLPPGGGTDGQDIMSAARREAQEEAGFTPQSLTMIDIPEAVDTWDESTRAAQKEGRRSFDGCTTRFVLGAVRDANEVHDLYASAGDGMRFTGRWMSLNAALGLAQMQAYTGSPSYRRRDAAFVDALRRIDSTRASKTASSYLDVKPATMSQATERPSAPTAGSDAARVGTRSSSESSSARQAISAVERIIRSSSPALAPQSSTSRPT